MSQVPMVERVIRLKPRQFIHVLDNNTGVTRLDVGPQVVTLQDHEILVLSPQPMLIVPPRHYCVIRNPVVRDAKGEVERDRHGQVKVRDGDSEVRFGQEPFALYPGESVAQGVTPLQIVPPNTGLRLRAIRDFVSGSGDVSARNAGDEWMFVGPGTYTPRVEVEVVATVVATVIKPNQALHLRAAKTFRDREGRERKTGEEWLERVQGSYLPDVDEEVVGMVDAVILTDKTALHLQATRTFTDIFGKKRRAGDEWLVTLSEAETHIPDVYEKVVGIVSITTLNDREWCEVLDPLGTDGKTQLGKREVRRGRTSFFLHPGEKLSGGVQKVYVLGEREALLLSANEAFEDQSTKRKPGDHWMIVGPLEYIPRVEVEVVERRSAIPLDKNEGIYVRNTQTGEVRLVRGPSVYLLSPEEALWEKELPVVVEQLLLRDPVLDRFNDGTKTLEKPALKRDKSRAVTFRVSQGAACQVFDFKQSKARVVFGPDLVMLEPDEGFTVLSLSGGRPKRAKMHESLALLLGPDFMVDVITVETSDHAQLRLQLAYNWYFDIQNKSTDVASKLFQVPDYVGDACNSIASRIRGVVAGVRFEVFHKNQALIIRDAVFGSTQEGKPQELRFPANNLVVTNIDIQSVEPVDEQTRLSLQRSVQIAIKITTDAQEAAARHDAERLEQEAKARIERQTLIDQRESESERRALLALQADSVAVQSTGKAAAEARAKAESERIAGEAAIKLAEQEVEASTIRHEAEVVRLRVQHELELAHRKAIDELELAKARSLGELQTREFEAKVKVLGADTIRSMAQAGPELQAKLLQSLGIKSVLITDGNSPVNLFQTASGLIDQAMSQKDK